MPRINNPQAMMVVWNYEGRMGANSMTIPKDASNQAGWGHGEIFVMSASIKSIQTQKTKDSPSGQFQIELAPTFNWLARITVGSWVAIFMTQDIIIEKTFGMSPAGINGTVPKRKMLKMIGRIDSVRCDVSVDQNTGARNTSYIVNGRDWGCVFENVMYIDGLAFPDQQNNGLADAMVVLKTIIPMDGSDNNGSILPNTTMLVNKIKDFYGRMQPTLNVAGNALLGAQLFPSQVMTIPIGLKTFFNFKGATLTGSTSTAVSEIITVKSGVLMGYDEYDEKVEDSVGLPNGASFVGGHTFWQLLTEHSNTVLNEMVAEIRWEDDNFPMLALYKRLRPFVANEKNIDEYASKQTQPPGTNEAHKLASKFVNLKQNVIPAKDVISVSLGNNWRDAINFIEILYDDAEAVEIAGFSNNELKRSSQIINKASVARDGLKPMLLKTKFYPGTGMTPPNKAMPWGPMIMGQWAPLLYEWYSHTHLMLNGTISFVGQNDYIGVGENLMVDASILGGVANLNSKVKAERDNDTSIYLLAHIESVSHGFTVGANGARSFLTTVQFVRGVFTNQNADTLYLPNGDALDSSIMADTKELKYNRMKVWTTTELDPDIYPQKGT